MTISNSTRALAATAFIALLAGCSGGSQLSPTGTTGSAASSAHRLTKSGHVAQLFASKQANAAAQHGRPVVNLSGRGFMPFKKKAAGMVFASDNITGNVDVYDESTGDMVSQCAGCGGWGLAVSHKGLLAIGTYDQTITLWQITASAITQTGTCTMSGGGEGAYGIAFAGNGGIYSDNWPANSIDEFTKSNVNGGCGAPDKTVYTTNLEAVYFVAVAGKKPLLAEGYTGDLDVDLVSVDPRTGNDTILQNNGNLSEGTGFPGGITVAKANQTVYVDNQYGSITGYSNAGSGSETGSCTWGFDPNDYTAITTNSKDNGIFGADINFGGSPLETYGEEVGLPTSGSCSVQLDTSPEQANEEYLGIATYKAGRT